MKRSVLATVLTALLITGLATAAAPPDRIHYQGVLRDSADIPLDGNHDMIFHFFPADVGGDEILIDAHDALGAFPVMVSGGLFSVDLGTGVITDGSGPGTYSSLAEVFRDNSQIWVAVEVDGEVLLPRVEVMSTGFALNADYLDGLDSTSFLKVEIDPQVGILTASKWCSNNGTRIDCTEEVPVAVEIDPQVGSAVPHRVAKWGGTTLVDSAIYEKAGMVGIGTDTPGAVLDVAGDVEVDGQNIRLGAFNAKISSLSVNGGLIIDTGGNDTSDLTLIAGNDFSDGQIHIEGDADITLRAGNGLFSFFRGDTGAKTAELTANGNLQIDGSLDIDGQRIEGPPAANFSIESFSSLHLQADTHVRTMIDDDNTTTAGEALWYSNGQYNSTGQLAELQEDGDFRIGGTLSQNVAFDIAESFLASEPLEAGDVVRLDPDRAGAVLRSTGADDTFVLGVISSKPGMLLGSAPFNPVSLREVWGDEIAGEFEASRERLRKTVVTEFPEFARRALEKEDAEALRAEQEDEIVSLSLEQFFEELFVPVALAGRVPVKVDASLVPIQPGDALSPGPTPGVAVKSDGTGPVIGTALEGMTDGIGKVLAFVHRSPSAPERLATELEKRIPDPVTGTQPVTGNLQVVLDANADKDSRFSVFRDGNRDTSLGDEIFRVDENGNVYARGSFRPSSMDLAEYFRVDESVEAGDVLAVDLDNPGLYRKARTTGDPAVVGIVSEDPGVLLGSGMRRIAAANLELAEQLDEARRLGDSEEEALIWQAMETEFRRTHAAIALAGTAPIKVDAGYGAIRPGDLLMSSPNPGYAMRITDPAPGTVVGKALEGLESGIGSILALVSPPMR